MRCILPVLDFSNLSPLLITLPSTLLLSVIPFLIIVLLYAERQRGETARRDRARIDRARGYCVQSEFVVGNLMNGISLILSK